VTRFECNGIESGSLSVGDCPDAHIEFWKKVFERSNGDDIQTGGEIEEAANLEVRTALTVDLFSDYRSTGIITSVRPPIVSFCD
jgi:hypothetical protein